MRELDCYMPADAYNVSVHFFKPYCLAPVIIDFSHKVSQSEKKPQVLDNMAVLSFRQGLLCFFFPERFYVDFFHSTLGCSMFL